MVFRTDFRSLASWRSRSLILAVIVLVGIPSACSGRTDVEVLEVSVQNEGETLMFEVSTCNEDSTELSVAESDNEIIVTASTRAGFSCGGDDYSDPRSVELDEPLGDRRIVDRDGNEIRRLDP